MCWSQSTSFLTFGIGSILNFLAYISLQQSNKAAIIIAYWQYCLLMQIPEGVVWNLYDNGYSDVTIPSRIAMLLNVTQPIVLLAIAYSTNSQIKFAHVACFMYVMGLLGDSIQLWQISASILPQEDCHHLDLNYWNGTRSILYFFSSFFAFAEMKPTHIAFVHFSIFILTFIISNVLYTCGGGSLWCWSIFVAGPIVVLATSCEKISSPKNFRWIFQN